MQVVGILFPSVKVLKQEVKPFSWLDIKSDGKMKFYIGILSIAVFNVVFSLIFQCIPKS